MHTTARRILLVLAFLACLAAAGVPAGAIQLPSDFTVLDVGGGTTFVQPVALAFAPDGRIFVVERRGRIYVLAPDPGAADPRSGYTKLEPPFLAIESEVLDNWDRGMLAIALDPDFETNGYVYFAYVAETSATQPDFVQDAYSKVERVTVSAGDPNVADLATRTVLLGETWTTGAASAHTSHTVGTLVFGDDGTLLFSVGDGAHFDFVDAGGNDPEMFLPGRTDPMEDIGSYRSQYLGSLAGKVLRMDPATGDGVPSNPFYDPLAPRSPQSRVWAYGLRNAFRMDVKRGSGSTDAADGQPGLLALGEVGWTTWEEVNLAHGGENFGWPCYEGNGEQPSYQLASPMHTGCPPDDSGITDPIFTYPHVGTASQPIPGLSGVAAVGATFHSGTNYPMAYRNMLYVAEYGQRWIYGLRLDENERVVELVPFATDAATAVELRHDPWSSDLFAVDYTAGRVQRYVYEGPDGAGADPSQPLGLSAVADGEVVRLQWQFNPEVDVVGYEVYRATTASGPWTKITSTPIADGRFVDDGSLAPLADDTIYWYQVEAIDSEVPARSSLRSESAPVAFTAQSWEWYVPHYGPTMTMTDLPASFPRRLALPSPFVVPNYDFAAGVDRAPQLRTFELPADDFTLEADVQLVKYFSNRDFHAGIMVGFSQYDALIWGFYRGTGLRLERVGVGNLGTATNTSPRAQLRVVRTGTQYSFEYRANATSPWQVGAVYSTTSTPTFAGVMTRAWQNFTIPLDIDVHSLGIDEVAPVAVASASPTSGPGPLTVDFTSNSYDPDGNLLLHTWNFGGGQLSTEADPSFVFPTPGVWPVVLTVKDAAGLTATDNLTITVQGNSPPTASILAPVDGFEYVDPFAPIALSASASDPDQPAASLTVTWSVDLHHGAQDTLGYLTPPPGLQSSFVPAIADDGQGISLDVVLTVTDAQGASATDTVTVVDASLPLLARLDLRAALADGLGSPVVPGASGPWVNLGLAGPAADGVLSGFAGTASSGWQGTGVPGDPLRLQFDGIDDVVVVGPTAIGTLGDGATLELRMRTPADVQSRSYIGEWLATFAPPFPGCSLAIENGQLRLYLGGWVDLTPVVPERWYHVLVVKSSTTWRAWVDGVEVASGAGSNLGDQLSEFVLGAGTFAGSGVYTEHFDGAIGEVRVFDQVASSAHLTVLADAAAPAYANAPRIAGIDPASLVNDATASGVRIDGLDFVDGAVVTLERAGESTIVATAVQFVDSTRLIVELPVSGAVAGPWTLRVENPDGQSEAAVDAVLVSEPSPAFLELLAERVDGQAPPAVPSAQSPWASTVGSLALDLQGFAGDTSSGWQGDGVYQGPYRLRFDGVDDQVSLAPAAIGELDTLTALSVEIWARISQVPTATATLLEWWESDAPALGFSLVVSGDSLRLRHDDAEVRTLAAMPVGAWTLITVTQDAGSVDAYLDGTPVYSGPAAPIAAQTSTLVIGASTTGAARFAGDLAVVRLSHLAFDAATVAERHDDQRVLFDALPQAVLALHGPASAVGEGATFEVEVQYDDQGDPFGVRAASLRVDYDAQMITLIDVTEGEFLSSAGSTFFTVDTSQLGSVVFDTAVLGATAGANGTGRIAVLHFAHSVAGTDVTTPVQLTADALFDAQDPPQEVPHRVEGPLTVRIDALPPPPLQALQASAADSSAVVRWTRPVEETVDVVVLTRPWTLDATQGFPLFGRASAAPQWPVDEEQAVLDGWTVTAAGDEDSLVVAAARTVLSVIAYTRDGAGNASSLATAPRTRTATYRITDLGGLDGNSAWIASFDGFVDRGLDTAVLEATYGASSADPEFLPVADFAPTSDATLAGWPQPDGHVGFAELLLLALDFEPEQAVLDSFVVLQWPAGPSPTKIVLGSPLAMANDRLRLPVSLSGNPGTLRALHVPVHFSGAGAALVSVEPIPAWNGEVGFAAFHAGGDSVVVDVAVLGAGAELIGDGPLAWLEFSHVPGAVPDFSFGALEARASDGSALPIEGSVTPITTDAPVVVSSTVLYAASPNPFNPRTTVRFDLALRGAVRLRVYDLSGRLVSVLVDGTLEVGSHEAVWDGRDVSGRQVASGVYLYELQAPDGGRQMRKMSLIK